MDIKAIQAKRAAIEMEIFEFISDRVDDFQKETGLSPSSISIGVLSVHPIGARRAGFVIQGVRSEEHTSELQSPEAISYAVFCLDRKSVV